MQDITSFEDALVIARGDAPLNLHEVFEAGWTFHDMTRFACDSGRDMGRILVADFWPPLLRGMEKTAGVDGAMTGSEAIVKVKQEIERRLLAATA
jgi:hypothetical protein